MSDVKVIKKKKNGFVFNVSINKEKRVIHAWLKEFAPTYANITINERALDENGDYNIVKRITVPMFNEVPKDENGSIAIRGIAKCHPNDEWKTGIGIDLAVDRCYNKAYKILKDSIMKTVGGSS